MNNGHQPCDPTQRESSPDLVPEIECPREVASKSDEEEGDGETIHGAAERGREFKKSGPATAKKLISMKKKTVCPSLQCSHFWMNVPRLLRRPIYSICVRTHSCDAILDGFIRPCPLSHSFVWMEVFVYCVDERGVDGWPSSTSHVVKVDE